MSLECNQCAAITEFGTRCTRKADINSIYCWQHNKIKIEQELIPAISNNILSDYIEYEQLKELENEFEGLKINPDRIQIQDYFDEEKEQTIQIYSVDDDIIKIIIIDEYGEKISEDNYKNREWIE